MVGKEFEEKSWESDVSGEEHVDFIIGVVVVDCKETPKVQA